MALRAEDGFPRTGRAFWHRAMGFARALLGFWFALDRSGEELIPDGPVVFAANHFSHLDPVLVGVTVGRPVRYLAVDELYGNSAFFDGLTVWLGAIPMSRTRAPLGALRMALETLAAGDSVGLFPEGVRVWTWGEIDGKRGAAWLAQRAGVPLVPIAILGSDDAMGRGTMRIERRKIRTQVCAPIHPEDHVADADPLTSMTDLWEARIGEALGELRSR